MKTNNFLKTFLFLFLLTNSVGISLAFAGNFQLNAWLNKNDYSRPSSSYNDVLTGCSELYTGKTRSYFAYSAWSNSGVRDIEDEQATAVTYFFDNLDPEANPTLSTHAWTNNTVIMSTGRYDNCASDSNGFVVSQQDQGAGYVNLGTNASVGVDRYVPGSTVHFDVSDAAGRTLNDQIFDDPVLYDNVAPIIGSIPAVDPAMGASYGGIVCEGYQSSSDHYRIPEYVNENLLWFNGGVDCIAQIEDLPSGDNISAASGVAGSLVFSGGTENPSPIIRSTIKTASASDTLAEAMDPVSVYFDYDFTQEQESDYNALLTAEDGASNQFSQVSVSNVAINIDKTPPEINPLECNIIDSFDMNGYDYFGGPGTLGGSSCTTQLIDPLSNGVRSNLALWDAWIWSEGPGESIDTTGMATYGWVQDLSLADPSLIGIQYLGKKQNIGMVDLGFSEFSWVPGNTARTYYTKMQCVIDNAGNYSGVGCVDPNKNNPDSSADLAKDVTPPQCVETSLRSNDYGWMEEDVWTNEDYVTADVKEEHCIETDQLLLANGDLIDGVGCGDEYYTDSPGRRVDLLNFGDYAQAGDVIIKDRLNNTIENGSWLSHISTESLTCPASVGAPIDRLAPDIKDDGIVCTLPLGDDGWYRYDQANINCEVTFEDALRDGSGSSGIVQLEESGELFSASPAENVTVTVMGQTLTPEQGGTGETTEASVVSIFAKEQASPYPYVGNYQLEDAAGNTQSGTVVSPYEIKIDRTLPSADGGVTCDTVSDEWTNTDVNCMIEAQDETPGGNDNTTYLGSLSSAEASGVNEITLSFAGYGEGGHLSGTTTGEDQASFVFEEDMNRNSIFTGSFRDRAYNEVNNENLGNWIVKIDKQKPLTTNSGGISDIQASSNVVSSSSGTWSNQPAVVQVTAREDVSLGAFSGISELIVSGFGDLGTTHDWNKPLNTDTEELESYTVLATYSQDQVSYIKPTIQSRDHAGNISDSFTVTEDYYVKIDTHEPLIKSDLNCYSDSGNYPGGDWSQIPVTCEFEVEEDQTSGVWSGLNSFNLRAEQISGRGNHSLTSASNYGLQSNGSQGNDGTTSLPFTLTFDQGMDRVLNFTSIGSDWATNESSFALGNKEIMIDEENPTMTPVNLPFNVDIWTNQDVSFGLMGQDVSENGSYSGIQNFNIEAFTPALPELIPTFDLGDLGTDKRGELLHVESLTYSVEQNEQYGGTYGVNDYSGRGDILSVGDFYVAIDKTLPQLNDSDSCQYSDGSGDYNEEWTDKNVTCDFEVVDPISVGTYSGFKQANVSFRKKSGNGPILTAQNNIVYPTVYPPDQGFYNIGLTSGDFEDNIEAIYEVTGILTDQAGNSLNSSTGEYHINIDKTDPLITGTSIQQGSSGNSVDNISVSSGTYSPVEADEDLVFVISMQDPGSVPDNVWSGWHEVSHVLTGPEGESLTEVFQSDINSKGPQSVDYRVELPGSVYPAGEYSLEVTGLDMALNEVTENFYFEIKASEILELDSSITYSCDEGKVNGSTVGSDCSGALVLTDRFGNPYGYDIEGVSWLTPATDGSDLVDDTDGVSVSDFNMIENEDSDAKSFIDGIFYTGIGSTINGESTGVIDFDIGSYVPTLETIFSASGEPIGSRGESRELTFVIPNYEVEVDGSISDSNNGFIRKTGDVILGKPVWNELVPEYNVPLDSSSGALPIINENPYRISNQEVSSGGFSFLTNIRPYKIDSINLLEDLDDPSSEILSPIPGKEDLGMNTDFVFVPKVTDDSISIPTLLITFVSILQTTINSKTLMYPGDVFGDGTYHSYPPLDITQLFPPDEIPDGLDGEPFFFSLLPGADIEGAIKDTSSLVRNLPGYADDQTDTQIISTTDSVVDPREDILAGTYRVIRGLEAEGGATGQIVNTNLKNGGVTYINSISNNPQTFASEVFEIEGTGKRTHTFVIEGANLVIDKDLKYNDSLNESIGIIVLGEGIEDSGLHSSELGNILVESDVKHFVGTYYAEGSLLSIKEDSGGFDLSDDLIDYQEEDDTDELNNQLILEGFLFTRNTLGGGYGEVNDGVRVYWTPWEGLREDLKREAQKYDLHYIRQYTVPRRGELDEFGEPTGDIVINVPIHGRRCSSLGAIPGGVISTNVHCYENNHAFVIRMDAKVRENPPPAFTVQEGFWLNQE